MVAAAALTRRERRPPFLQGDQDRFGGAQIYVKRARQATGALDFPSMVTKVLPHGALDQVVDHASLANLDKPSGRQHGGSIAQ